MTRRTTVAFAIVCLSVLGFVTTAQAQTGSISGTLTNGGATTVGGIAPGAGIPNVIVQACNNDNCFGFTFTSNGVGTPVGFYQISNLPAGSYRVFTQNSLGFIDQYYKAGATFDPGPTFVIECAGCQPTLSGGSAVPVGTINVPNINIALRGGPRISGRVTTTAGAPIANVGLNFLRSSGSWFSASFVQSDEAGNFTSGAAFPPGIGITVRTSNQARYIDEAFDNVTCIGGSCDPSAGFSIVFPSVTSGNFTKAVFGLAQGGTISGTVTDGAEPISFANVTIYNSVGNFVTGTSADESGVYTTSGLPSGQYFAIAQVFGGQSFVPKLYNDIPCSGCSVTSGTPITVKQPAETANINFVLQAAGAISGTVVDASNGAPIGNGSVQVYTPGGVFVASTGTAPGTGAYTVSGLPTGQYIVKAGGPFNGIYISKVYAEPVSFDCVNCDVTAGTPKFVFQPETVSGVDFALNRGGTITGTITNGSGTTVGTIAPGAPIPNLGVTILNATGAFVASGSTNGSGVYTIGGLLAGSYYVRTNTPSNPANNFIPEIFTAAAGDHATCVSCPVSNGTALAVALGGTQTANFSLLAGGVISGTITVSGTGAPVAQASIQLFNTAGTSVAFGNTSGTGTYSFAGLPAGTYFARTNAGQGLIDQVYDAITCVGCSVTGGTPIVLGAGETRNGISFALVPGGRISGKITDQNGAPLASGQAGFVSASIYNSSGNFVTSASTNSAGVYLTTGGLPSGTYYVLSSNSLGYINTLYNDISCSSCAPNSGTPVPVTIGMTSSGIDLVLRPGGRISGIVVSGSDEGGEVAPVPNAFVEAYSSQGAFVSSAVTNVFGAYTLVGLPTDDYFVKTRNGLGFIDELYDGAMCLGCDVMAGTPVRATVGSTTSPVDFVLQRGGAISGTVTDALGNPLANVSVQIHNSTGAFVTSVQTQVNGTYNARGLASGSYFARTFNSLGYINRLKGTPADIVCGSCIVTDGAPITVTAPEGTPGVDFALDLGGTVKGRVTSNGTTAIAGVSITLANPNANGASLGFATTDTLGNYAITGVIPGKFLVKTSNSQGFIDEIYNNVECVNCTATNGNVVEIVNPGDVIGDIDFVLAAGGRIRGRVTDNATPPNPLGGVTVEVYRRSGSFVASTSTNSLGNWVSGTGLPAGEYYVKTRNSLGFVDEVFNDITCVGCQVATASGAIITLTGAPGAVTSVDNINFSLSAGGGMSGKVTEADGTTPIQGAFVQFYTEAGSFISSTSTNGLGQYVFRGLPTGRYFARTSNSSGFIDVLYNGVACTSCNVTVGTPIAVTVGAVTPNIDFALAPGGRVTGTVTAAVGGQPIPNVSVQIYSSTGTFVTSGFTSSTGVYISGALPAGSYYARTFNSSGFINLLHAVPTDITCTSCTVTAGTSFPVVPGPMLTTINFALPVGGAISGIVTESATRGGKPIPNVSVQVYTASGSFVNSANTNSAGVYVVGGLTNGSYRLRTSNTSGFIDELFDNQSCLGCNPATGTPVPVTEGMTTTGQNFALEAGGLVTGVITDAATGKGISNITVQFFNAANFFVASGTTDNTGRYTTRQGMPAGTYFARTSNSVGYINVTYPSNTCLNCVITVGSPIPVALGATTSGIDFSLTLGGRITGTVTDAANGQPVQGVSISFFLESGQSVGGGFTNSLGVYTSPGLPAGTYYARTSNSLGYVNRVFNGIDCVRCTVTRGTPIAVATGLATGSIDFALSRGARIAGTIKDAITNAPLAGVTVSVFDAAGFSVTSAFTNASGEYLTTAGLSSGDYYVRTNNQLGYVNKLYESFTCLQCNVTTGKPVPLTAGMTTTGINFALNPGGRIAGTVKGNGVPLPDAFVGVFTSGGTFLASAVTGSGGQYISGEGLPPGQYYLVTQNEGGFVDELYNNNQCGFACAVTSGQAVTIVGTATTPGIDFDLAAGGRISGRVTDLATGLGIPNVPIQVYNRAGVVVTSGFTDGLGNYTTLGGMPTGEYFVGTFVSSRTLQYVNEMFDDRTCAGCDPVSGAPVAVVAGAVTPNINFALGAGEVMTGNVTDQSTGRPIAAVSVRFFSTLGRLVGSGSTDDAGNYVLTTALPAGTYFARTSNNQGYIDELYDNQVCLACEVTRGAPVVVDGLGTTGIVNFQLTPGGRIAGTVTGADPDTGVVGPVAGSQVRFFNSAGSFLGQTFTNGNGQYTSPGLPPGNYFVRTSNSSGFIDELYDNVKCSPCTVGQGTPVAVVTGGLRSGIDFLLDAGGLVSGYVKDELTGSPIPGVTVSIYKAGVKVATTDATDTNGYYQISLPIGVYQVEPNPVAGYRIPNLGSLLPAARSTVTVDTGTETTGVGFTLLQCTPLIVNPTTLPLATQGQPYSTTLTAEGGTAPYTFSIVDGAPNTGLTLNASGLLNGTPAFPGTGNFTVAATDINFCAGTRVFALTACSFFLSTNSASITAAGGDGAVSLFASATDCTWTATTPASWITITSAASGVGAATVTFSVAVNTSGAVRTGVITIGGQAFTVTQAAPTSNPPFGSIDTPADGATGLSGSIAIGGWALDDVEVKRVVISRDPVPGEALPNIFIGDAVLVEGARPDVAAGFPTLPLNTRAGWGYLLLSNMLPNQGNGTFVLHVDAIDAEGVSKRLGSRTLTFNNLGAVKPFGAIDTPGQGQVVSGTIINFGWALTPQPKNIPLDGSTITVFIDGAPAGNATYGALRPDVQFLFPGLANTDTASGFRVFDTTTWTNGVHTIFWIVSDSAGDAEGIGSRYYSVNNVLASVRTAPARALTLNAPMQASRVFTDAPAPPVQFSTVLRPGAPMLELAPRPDGRRFATFDQLGRFTLRFNEACGAVTGRQIVNGEAVPLPIGSTLDSSGGFAWHPGPAVLGTFSFEFTVPSCTGAPATIPVDVTVTAGR